MRSPRSTMPCARNARAAATTPSSSSGARLPSWVSRSGPQWMSPTTARRVGGIMPVAAEEAVLGPCGAQLFEAGFERVHDPLHLLGVRLRAEVADPDHFSGELLRPPAIAMPWRDRSPCTI